MRSSTGDVLQEKAFLEISQNSQENTCARVSFLIKLQTQEKEKTPTQVFYYGICEIFETSTLKNIYERLLLSADSILIQINISRSATKLEVFLFYLPSSNLKQKKNDLATIRFELMTLFRGFLVTHPY